MDLPGYGYAKVAKTEVAKWAKLIEGYLNQKRRFALVASLVDIRIPPQKLDIQMIDFSRRSTSVLRGAHQGR